MCRLLSLYALLCLLSLNASGQFSFYQVTAGSGIQTVAGVNVNITPKDSAKVTNSQYNYGGSCVFNTYYFIGYGNHDTTHGIGGSFSYTFSPAVKYVKLNLFGMDQKEEISFYLNGAKYHLKKSDITVNANCSTITNLDTSAPPYINSGDLVADLDGALGYINLSVPNGVIDSMRVSHLTGNVDGTGYELYIATPDTTFNITQPFKDTALCPGDTLKIRYDVTVKFPSNNVFKAYLSDSSGSFASAIFLDSLVSDTSGVIKWVVPSNIIAGSHYRVKMTSSIPVRHPSDNLSNIKIGTVPEQAVTSVNTPLCTGSSIDLDAFSPTSGVGYTWTGPNFFFSTQQSPVISNAGLYHSGTYYVRTNLYYCYRTDSIVITINQAPANSITAISNSPVCSGDTVRLSSTNTYAGSVYKWSGPAGFTSAKQKDTIALTAPYMSGKYIVKATLGVCSITDTTNVTIKQLPLPIVATSNSPVCEGDSLKFSTANALAGTVFTWTGPDNFYTQQQKPSFDTTKTKSSGTYKVKATLFGCSIYDSTTAIAKLMPGKPLAFSNSPVCVGDSLHLFATDTTSGLFYKWQGPYNFKSTQQDTVIHNTGFEYRGKYIVTASLNGCSQTSDSTLVIIHTIPTPVATEVTPVCEGDSIQLKASDTTTGVNFKWYSPTGAILSNQKTVTILKTSVSQSGRYFVTSTIDNCIGRDSVAVTIKPMPDVPTLFSNAPICSGNDLLLGTDYSLSGLLYQWTGPDGFNSSLQNPVIDSASILASGVYKLLVDLNGCKTSNTATVLVKPTPYMSLNANNPLSIGQDLRINVMNPISGTSFAWAGPNNFISFTQIVMVNHVNASNGGMYRVTALLDGCIAYDSILIEIKDVADTGNYILYPNPNDGKFTLSGLLHADQRVNYEVLDSRGQTVYKNATNTVDKLLYIDFDIPYLREGVYLLRFKADGAVITRRFVVLR